MGDNPFSKLDAEEIDRVAGEHGFKRRGQRNWVRRTADFVQLVNLQRSQWSPDDHYLNFALWPLAFSEPPTIAESKFHFRTRAERMGATNLSEMFARADALATLAQLRTAEASGQISGLVTLKLRDLLAQS